ncbi:MAG: hypothetical protein BWY71_00231 [Planctomycetes bacterium ADurb.Bin412]|nr:MAG: hypothetical protein BWY71_00231 [Planctomycetes bacterium ADurb.Bin412]
MKTKEDCRNKSPAVFFFWFEFYNVYIKSYFSHDSAKRTRSVRAVVLSAPSRLQVGFQPGRPSLLSQAAAGLNSDKYILGAISLHPSCSFVFRGNLCRSRGRGSCLPLKIQCR